MNILGIVRVLAGLVGVLTAGFAFATTIVVNFPELDGPEHLSTDSFPRPSITVGTRSYTIPAGEQIIAATVSGYWGSTSYPYSTAGVDVLIDGVRGARCVKNDAGCWMNGTGQRAWSFTFTAVMV